jgi:hypothetical protein
VTTDFFDFFQALLFGKSLSDGGRAVGLAPIS